MIVSIVRFFLIVLKLIVVTLFSYIAMNIGQRVVAYSHYVIRTGNYPGKTRNPIGFSDL